MANVSPNNASDSYKSETRDVSLSARKNTIVLLGDSFLAQDTPGVTGDGNYGIRADGIWGWASYLLKQRLLVAHSVSDAEAGYMGVGSDTTAQVLARTPQAQALSAGYWLIMCGINDLTQGVPVSQITANLEAIVLAAQNTGTTPVLCTLPPSNSFNTDAMAVAWLSVNDWVRKYSWDNQGIILAEISDVYIDSAAPFPNPLAAYVRDGVHPNTRGAFSIGGRIFDAMDSTVIGNPAIYQNFYNSTSTDALFLSPNPGLNGTAGTTTAPVTGITANLFGSSIFPTDGSAACAASKVTRTDTTGAEWQELAFTGAATWTLDLDSCQVDLIAGTSVPSGIIPGTSIIQLFHEFEIDAGAVGYPMCRPSLRALGGTPQFFYAMRWETSAQFVEIPEDIPPGVIATAKFVVPPGTTSFDLFLRNNVIAANAAYTVRHGRTWVVQHL